MGRMRVFRQFARLPADIQAAVWTAALPATDPGTLFFFHSRFPDLFHEEDDGRQVPGALVKVKLSKIAFVSRDAHKAVMRWAAKQGIELHYCRTTASYSWVREWDPDKDPLYIPSHKWGQIERMASRMGHLGTLGPDIVHLAVSAYSLTDHFMILGPLLKHMVNLEATYAIWDHPPLVERTPKPPSSGRANDPPRPELALQLRWELRVMKGSKRMPRDTELFDRGIDYRWSGDPIMVPRPPVIKPTKFQRGYSLEVDDLWKRSRME